MRSSLSLSSFCRRSYIRCVSAANEQLAWGRPSSVRNPTTPTSAVAIPSLPPSSMRTIRPFSSRKNFEDDLHIGRACSKYKIDPKKVQSWKKKLGKVPALKLTVPDDLLFPQPEYEVKALQQIHERSYECNVLLEIRDVRVPASSHHPSFTRLGDHRLHLICYTHADMIDAETRDRVEEWTTKSWPNSRSIFVDTRDRPFAPKKKQANDEVGKGEEDEKEKNEEDKERPTSPYDMVYDSLLKHLEERGGINSALTVGVANTGKSSLLMALLRTARLRGDLPKKGLKAVTMPTRKKKGKKKKKKVEAVKKAIDIQDRPGKTREITEYLLREKPRAFFLDVPGMTPPTFFFRERPEAWFAFGAANLLPLGRRIEKDVEVVSAFCNYVLYALNRDSNFGYVVKLGLDAPTLDLQTVLDAVKQWKENREPERMRLEQCQSFLKLFNTGNFGPVILDDLSKPYKRFVFKDNHFVKKKTYKSDRFSDGSDDDDDDDDDDFYDDDDEDGFYK